MKTSKAQFITRTGVLLALCVVLQLALPATMTALKGPAVNIVLLVSAIAVGLPSGLIVAIVNPIFVFLLAPPAPMKLCPQIVFVVMLGNAAYVTFAWLFHKKYYGIPSLVAAVLMKTGAMMFSIHYLVVPFFGQALAAKDMVGTVETMFGIGQLSTAATGAVVFFIIWKILEKVPAFATKK